MVSVAVGSVEMLGVSVVVFDNRNIRAHRQQGVEVVSLIASDHLSDHESFMKSTKWDAD